MKLNFRLPNTKLCVIVWFRSPEKKGEIMMPTPANNEDLRNKMLRHKVGFSEIRCVKSVDGYDLAKAMTRI